MATEREERKERARRRREGEYFHAKGGCGISVGHTKYTNAYLLRVLGVHGLEKKRETMWKRSTHICFDGH